MSKRQIMARRDSYPGLASLFLAWTVVGVLAYLRHRLQVDRVGVKNRMWPELLSWLSCFYPWVFLAPVSFHIERRFPLQGKIWYRHLLVLALVGAAFSYGGMAATVWLNVGIASLFRQPLHIPDPVWSISLDELCLGQFLFWSTVLAGYVIRGRMQLRERDREAGQLAIQKSQLEASLKQAELEALRMRLNPHFLFNTLQNISSLVKRDPETASLMLARLGDLLRVALQHGIEPLVALEAEVGLTQAYLEMEQMRFGNRICVGFELAPDTRQALVPSLLLQPLVENALRHGLSGKSGAGTIRIKTAKEDDKLVLTVTDDGKGPPADRLQELEIGIGLGSTCERLARMYPNQNEVTLERLPEGGTKVRIELPFGLQGPSPQSEKYGYSTAHRG